MMGPEQEFVPEFGAYTRASVGMHTTVKHGLRSARDEAKDLLGDKLRSFNLDNEYYNDLYTLPNLHLYNFDLLIGAKNLKIHTIKDADTMVEKIYNLTNIKYPIEDIVRYYRLLGGSLISTTRAIPKTIKRTTKTTKRQTKN